MTSGGGAEAQGALAALILIAGSALLASVFLLISRFKWKHERDVDRAILRNWAIAPTAIVLLVFSVPFIIGGLKPFLMLLAFSMCGFAAGVAAAQFWLRFAYCIRLSNQALDPTSGNARSASPEAGQG